MKNVGRTLITVLENYLPREQTRLNLIGSKVLDIFYDEFIKFVPAYILKREQEQLQDQPIQTSPSHVNLPAANQLRDQSTQRKKQKPLAPFKPLLPRKKEGGTVTEPSDTEGFSQMI